VCDKQVLGDASASLPTLTVYLCPFQIPIPDRFVLGCRNLLVKHGD